jgi:hypothetical protein
MDYVLPSCIVGLFAVAFFIILSDDKYVPAIL